MTAMRAEPHLERAPRHDQALRRQRVRVELDVLLEPGATAGAQEDQQTRHVHQRQDGHADLDRQRDRRCQDAAEHPGQLELGLVTGTGSTEQGIGRHPLHEGVERVAPERRREPHQSGDQDEQRNGHAEHPDRGERSRNGDRDGDDLLLPKSTTQHRRGGVPDEGADRIAGGGDPVHVGRLAVASQRERDGEDEEPDRGTNRDHPDRAHQDDRAGGSRRTRGRRAAPAPGPSAARRAPRPTRRGTGSHRHEASTPDPWR